MTHFGSLKIIHSNVEKNFFFPVNFVFPQTLSSVSYPGRTIEKQKLSHETLFDKQYLDGSVIIEWMDSNLGWRSPGRHLKVLDSSQSIKLSTTQNQNQKNKIQIPSLITGLFELRFSPGII